MSTPTDESTPQPAGSPAGAEPGSQPVAPVTVDPEAAAADGTAAVAPEEVGGPPGPEPTRFGDWERKGRCIDF